ncbi:hypothetical protein [Sulfitobacter sp. SK012]|uniref:hypothetical protein n=1 Tax=Sulfitobacter sp. SK012 TaxID=1389005 RepID=UPI0013B4196D|nr:hypothetical protein [Sulfitobacter sp. SK012]
MARDTETTGKVFPPESTLVDVKTALSNGAQDFSLVIDTNGLTAVLLPEDIEVGRLIIVGRDLLLVQDDGMIVLLLGGAENQFIVQLPELILPASKLQAAAAKDGDWETLSEVRELDYFEILDPDSVRPGSGDQEPVVSGDPLIGLPYSPLLPPTEYIYPPRIDEEYFGDKGGTPPGETTIALNNPMATFETDSVSTLVPSQFIEFTLEFDQLGEEISQVTIEIAGLPQGTTTNSGQITVSAGTTGTLEFTGTLAEFNDLTLTFPADFSTQSRTDFAEGPFEGQISVATNFLGAANLDFQAFVFPEGDAEIEFVSPGTVPDESDAATTIRPADLLLPRVPDGDGSENLETLVLTIEGLPGGSTLASLGISLPTGADAQISDDPATGTVRLIITMDAANVADIPAAYDALSLMLPADFSTANRSDLSSGTALPLSVTLDIQTDEDQDPNTDTPTDGTATATRIVEIGFELDVVLTAPPTISAREDGDGLDGAGVTVDLGISVMAEDIDGSEDTTFVEITFTGIASNPQFSSGSYDSATSVWTGTMADANALTLQLPGDFSGDILAQIVAISPEGRIEVSQTINIEPAGDIEFNVAELTASETDAPLIITPSAAWQISVSDFDPNLPRETIDTVTLTLQGLPAGVIALGVPAGSITFNSALGGSFVFSGTEAEYLALQLSFPADFSTESPSANGLTLDGTLMATSTEDATGRTTPVSLRIAPEGDVVIDVVQPGIMPVETDAPTQLTPSQLLAPVVTDADGSESLQSLVLTIEGLPAGSTLASLQIVVPAGATAGIISDPATGASTLVLSLDAANVGDVAAAYAALDLTLPTDFSTANRTDLTNGNNTLGLTFRLDVQTDEDQDPGSDTPTDGTATLTRVVDIGFELDVDLSAPATIPGVEDGNGVGVTVDLSISVSPTDIDGSEDSTTVEIVYTGMPIGASFSGGNYSPATGIWSGTLVEANALTLSLPQDYSGTITSVITALSPEGSDSIPQEIVIAPSGDIVLDIQYLETQETDLRVVVSPSSAWTVRIEDTDPGPPTETVDTITLTLNDLPAQVLVIGVPASTITYSPLGGTFVFSGTEVQYLALQLSFPADYSTESPSGNGFTIGGSFEVTSTEDPVGVNAPVSLRITPEGDVVIDDTLTDTVPDETDTATLVTPSSLLSPSVTDLDGSEALQNLTLTITGLPGGSSLASLMITLPAGATATISNDLSNGSATLVLNMTAANVADVEAAYAGFNLTLPADFSTANRADLTDGSTTLQLTFRLDVQTDEDRDPNDDTPTDGTATATRVVDIDFESDIELDAPLRVDAQEDDGDPGDPDLGTDVDLGIVIAITDDDGSETADPSDPRFAAEVVIRFSTLPPLTGVNGGVLIGDDWTGTVAEAEALVLAIPGNYNGTILSIITVTTPEGQASTPQAIVVAPTPDIIISGFVEVDETDAPLEILLSDFISVAVDPGEAIQSLTFTLNGLPDAVLAVDGAGNNVGTITDNGDGTADFNFVYTGSGVSPVDVRLILPTDYSTENPAETFAASLVVTTGDGTVSGLIPFIVNAEGDVEVNDGLLALAETDAVLTFRPADTITPVVTDVDGSESVDQIAVVFNGLPAGTRFSIDNGVSFAVATSTLDFIGDLATYNQLVIELPADFSTDNPLTPLVADIVAVTDERGVDMGTLTITVDPEGDLQVSGPGSIALTENDAPADADEDTTTQAPLEFRLTDALTATTTDADGSESVAQVDVTIGGLPNDTFYSLDGGSSFVSVPSGPSFVLAGLTNAEYGDLVFRLPNDFSTTTDITGTVTFTTNEALLAGEIDLGPNDGVETAPFTITVASEQDVEITTSDITVIEDLGQPIPLNLDAGVTDIDGSEAITAITVEFSGLPAGNTVLSDGIVLNGPVAQWTGTLAQLQALGVDSFPTHFSGIIDIEVTVETNEGAPAGTSDSFRLNVTPVAEPTISLSVDDSVGNVDALGPDNFIVDEDTSFLLTFDASTPDQDGSEQLTQIVVENVPIGWVPSSAGNIDLSLFEQGQAQVATATLSGTTLTITFVSGVVAFDGALRVTPLADDDRDVRTLVGNDLAAIVTSEDTAAGLTTNTQTAFDRVDVDVDAIADAATLDVANTSANENRNNTRRLDIDLSNIGLSDVDGSEVFSGLELTISVATESDNFDPSDTSQLSLRITDAGLSGFVTITQTGSTVDSVSYILTPATGATPDQFSSALEALEVRLPQHFSGILTSDGTLSWNETTTGDVENDTTDNFQSDTFQITQTVRPRAEADLTASVFVRSVGEVAVGSPTIVSATVEDGSVAGAEILTLLESTGDGSGPGQVELFVGLDASTPDTDGSEQLETLVIENVPTDWVRDVLNGTSIDDSAFFTVDGSAPLSQAELNSIATAEFDAGTGQLTITFVPGVTSFQASLQLRPTLYEDYDVDRQTGDPFSAAGDFFGNDLNIVLTSVDDNSATTDDQISDAGFDVDIDPVNNISVILTLPVGNEATIDADGGVWQIPFLPIIQDNDGSEVVTAVVLRDIPSGITVYVPDLGDPTGPKIPALLTAVNQPPGFNSWSLEDGQWELAELRGIPLHTAGDFPLTIEVITTEDDGGGTRVTTLNETLIIDPVADGGDPSERTSTNEDNAVQVPIDGNLIDNPSNSPGSPEAVLDTVVISNIVPDSNDRLPRFFDGPPGPTLPNSTTAINEYTPTALGTLTLTAAQASNLWVLPGQDSNEDVVFDVSLVYFETLDPTQFTTGTGTIRIDVLGIADDPVVEAQDASGFLTPNLIDDIFRPGEITDGIPNSERVYGYAGYDTAPFELNSRLRDLVIDTGLFSSDPALTFTQNDVDPLSGVMTEILVPVGNPSADFDNSETIYYLITGVPPGAAFAGASPVDTTGETYLVSSSQLAGIEFVPVDVSEPTYYDLTFTAIVIEDDQTIPDLTGLPTNQVIAAIDALPGGATETIDFTIVVVPDPDGGSGMPCTPDQELPLPQLSLVGSGDEDTEIAFKLKITPNAFYDSIDDLVNLPNGVLGSFGLGIELPPGATLSSSPPGAVLYDPVTGLYVIDVSVLMVDPTDPTQTEGFLLFTPPENESSPANPFNPNDTYGSGDPYDSLDQIDYRMLLNNFTCGTTSTGNQSFAITINPVVDGPEVVLGGGNSFDEDTVYNLNLEINGIDLGERPSGDVIIEIDGTNGGQLLDSAGDPISGTDIGGGIIRYTVPQNQVNGLGLTAREHYSGPLEISITAGSQDIDGSVGTTTLVRTLTVTPVADTPTFVFDATDIDPETGQPFVDLGGATPVITAIEDIPFLLGSVLDPSSPDQDGSETVTIVLAGVPDYLEVTGPSGSGFIDNGDGTYTISIAAWPQVSVRLTDDHARLPDGLDPSLPTQIPLSIGVNTLELANSDEASGIQNIILMVRPDADTPTVDVQITPASGVEDDGTLYDLTISGITPDPHETMVFEITVPAGGKIFLDGVEQPVVAGTVTLSGGTGFAVLGGAGGLGFAPSGAVTFEAPPDFAGDVTLQIVSVTTDQSVNGSFTDEQRSAPAELTATITATPDLILTVTDPDVVLTETDVVVSHMPAGDFNIQVTDIDGSEVVDNVTYEIVGVPDGTSYQIGSNTPIAASGTLSFSGSLADFTQLQINFPADFATNGALLSGTLVVTTNEGGNETGNFTIEIDGELDLSVVVTPPLDDLPQTGSPTLIAFGIDAQITDTQLVPSETLEQVVVQFSAPPPAGTTASSGVLSGDRLTLVRGSTSPADFALLVASLSITVPGDFADVIDGDVTVTTNHGVANAEAFSISINDQPEVSGPISVSSTDTVFFIDFNTLLANATDADQPLSVENIMANDPDVGIAVQATGIEITVPNAYVGTPLLTYDVVDSATAPARTQATANLDIDTLQMVATGSTTTDPDGNVKDLLGDVSGGVGISDIATGTAGNDGVILSAAAPYTDIEGFELMGGSDFIDLSTSAVGYQIDLGDGDDWAIGSDGDDDISGGIGNDILQGGGGNNSLSGGAGQDIFVLTNLTASNVISDFDEPVGVGVDQIDLTALVTLNPSEVLADQVDYDNLSGDLSVNGTTVANVNSAAGGLAQEVEVIFNDANNMQTTAII